MNNERFESVAGKQICNNLPMQLLTDFKIHYNRTNTTDGRRTVTVQLTIDGHDYEGYTACSLSDNFQKKVGRKIALIRACREFWGKNYVI